MATLRKRPKNIRDARRPRKALRRVSPPTPEVGVGHWSFVPLTWAAIAGGGLSLLLGYRYGWDETQAAGVLALVVVAFAAALTLGRVRYRVELALGEENVTVGERAFGRIDVENASKRRLWASTLELPVGSGRAEFSLPSLGSGQTHEELFAVPTKKRAIITIGPVKSVRTDPLGLARREVVWTEAQQLYVHPKTVLLRGAAAGVLRDLEGQTLKTVTDNDMNFHALREYVPGDDRRAIHWKSSARNQSLMVRQFEDTRRTHTAIVFEDSHARWTDDTSFELGVSVFASLGVNTIRGEGDRTLLVSDQVLLSATPRSLLDATSGIEPDTGAASSFAAEHVARYAQDCSLAFIVMGRSTDSAQLRQEMRSLPPGVRAVVFQCEAGVEAHVQTHRLVTYASIGRLEELPRVLRQAVTA